MCKYPDGICHQDPCQNGVCGCVSFWQHTTPVLSPTNITTESGIVEACTLPIRKRKRDAGPNHSSRKGSATKRLRLDGCNERVKVQRGGLGAESVEAKINRQISGKRKKKGKESKGQLKREAEAKQGKNAVKVLVDYDLPTGDERLDWDTDEVRRMVGEIE